MQLEIRQTNMAKAPKRAPEARYAYYRRCQLFRRNGEQCKAPAEKGEAICHAHAAQQAMALRREIERGVVLAQAVAEMRRQGKPECEMADLFTDFKGIQVTLAVVSRALIDGRIDCKTAGRLLVGLQMASKALWIYHRDHRGTQREKALTTKIMKEHEGLLQTCSDERGLSASTSSNKREQPKLLMARTALTSAIAHEIGGRDLRVTFKVRMFAKSSRCCRDGRYREGPWEQARAA